MNQITTLILSGIDINFYLISALLFIDFSILSVFLFDIATKKKMCDWAMYSDNFSKTYRNNRNYTFLLKLFCLVSDEEDFSIFHFILNLIMLILLSFGFYFHFISVHLF